MIRIAVVGEIGSGKSHIAKLFNYPIFNADQEVAKIYMTNRQCLKELKKKLPKYFSSFPIKKEEVIKAINDSETGLKKIINIIHPKIRKKLNIFLKKNKKKKIVILDIPLLLENRLNKKGDIIIFIQSKKKEILKRLKKRENFNLDLFKKFKKMQLSLIYKKKKSKFTIKNDFTNKTVTAIIKKILKKIL
jgi:dephospho-CoA kinase